MIKPGYNWLLYHIKSFLISILNFDPTMMRFGSTATADETWKGTGSGEGMEEPTFLASMQSSLFARTSVETITPFRVRVASEQIIRAFEIVIWSLCCWCWGGGC